MRLQRITTSSRWIPEIDGMRFVAILSVLLIHTIGEMTHRSTIAAAQSSQRPFFLKEMYLLGRGVQLFFVISGYILALPFLRQHVDHGKPVSIGGFYLRRLTRLEPPYILSLLLYATVAAFGKHLGMHIAAQSFISSMLYVQNLHLFWPTVPSLNLVTWSLEVEVQFYLLAPFLALLFCIPNVIARRMVLISLILISALPTWGPMHGFRLPEELCYFIVGFLLADLRVPARTAWRSALWDVASLVLWPAFFFLPTFRFTPVLMCLLLTACFTGAFAGPVFRRMLSWQPLALIGGMCYSIYLMHLMVMSAALSVTRHLIIFPNFYMNYAVQIAVLLPATLAVGAVYFVAVERPCMQVGWHLRLWRKITIGSGKQSHDIPSGASTVRDATR